MTKHQFAMAWKGVWPIFVLLPLLYFGYASNDAKQSLISDVGIFFDDTDQVSQEMLPYITFEPSQTRTASGYYDGKIWFRIQIRDDSPIQNDKLLLQVSVPNLDFVELNYQNLEKQWVTAATGDVFAMSERPWYSPRLGFVIYRSDLLDGIIYLGIQNTGSSAVSVSLGDWQGMQQSQAIYHLTAVVLLVVFVCVFGATIYLYQQTHDRLFVFLIVNLVSYFAAAASYSGILSTVLPNISTDRLTSLLVPLAVFTTIVFHYQLSKKLNFRHLVLGAQFSIIVAYTVLLLGQAVLQPQFAFQCSWYLSFGFLVVLLLGAWTAASKTFLSMKEIRTSYTLFVMAALIWILPLNGWLPVTEEIFWAPMAYSIFSAVLVFWMTRNFAQEKFKRRAASAERLQKFKVEAQLQERVTVLYRDLLWTLTHEIGTGLSVFRFALSKPVISDANKERMLRALGALETLLENFNFSERVESDQIVVKKQNMNLVEVLRSEIESCFGNEQTINFTIAGSLSDGAVVQTDEACVRTALANVLCNARKYRDPSTSVSVELNEEEGAFVVMVENFFEVGSAPDANRVFDRFYRGLKVLDRPGSGLGLYLTQRLLQLVGGRCSFELCMNEKARVVIWIPKNLAR